MNDWGQLAATFGTLPTEYIKRESHRCDDCAAFNRGKLRADRRRTGFPVVFIDTSKQAFERKRARPWQRCPRCHEAHEAGRAREA